ncbi:polyprenyl synthetase family protein [[Eubacterium] rectale]|uniref:Farnesyl diphosphate synthase n=1 Tax=Agathobacter rectalis TaxID=39491 RepID=A0AAW4U5I3_9FIRM|nr:farnesyl diphosphate synthase [Agathobacter rectalis]MCB5929498.1 polyprenyl synthetase family protein [Agathobacter rectalis]MCB6937030.1 polyprenyl synthetase family protein [Agathobacter rectalis]MCB6969057.1 polyprenyl synthetase family protein [Agathobacter rectalis]MCQ4890442.1 polyprenyl synthetase family protein [Agathobacter rectalis]MCQ4930314.1 polyprenyl synthetase family protein [Agathobacter rectalis]
MSLNGNLNKSQFMEELQQKVEHINNVLEKFLPAEEGQQRIIFEAMNYSVRAGGKRLRPILMEETYHMFGGSSAVIEPFMAAIEMIHTYSLVHDDLPAMDNDEYRRGKKTTHAVYGEAMGILAGDALLNLAYVTAAKAFDMEVADARVARAITVLAKKAGVYGMVGGQVVDVESEKSDDCPITREKLDFIYRLKTGALIESSMMIGAILAGASSDEVSRVEQIAAKLGLAFQIQDDVLDVTSTLEVLGKPVGSDEKNNKATYVTFEGLDKAVSDVERISKEAEEQLDDLGYDDAFLKELFEYLIHREK